MRGRRGGEGSRHDAGEGDLRYEEEAGGVVGSPDGSVEQAAGREVDEEEAAKDWAHLTVTIGVIGTAAGVAMFVRDIMVVFGFMGAFLCSPLFFVLPAGLLLWLLHVDQPQDEAGMKGESLLGSGQAPPQEIPRRVAVVLACVWLITVGIGTGVVSIRKFLLS